MRTTIVFSTLIGCLLLVLSLWNPQCGMIEHPSAGEPAAGAATVALDESHGDDALAQKGLSPLPPETIPTLAAVPSAHSRLTVSTIFRPPIV